MVSLKRLERKFSLGERWNGSIQLGFVSLNKIFHLLQFQNILTIALKNIHYLYATQLGPSPLYKVKNVSPEVERISLDPASN